MSTFISGETGGVCPMLNTDMLGYSLKHHEKPKVSGQTLQQSQTLNPVTA